MLKRSMEHKLQELMFVQLMDAILMVKIIVLMLDVQHILELKTLVKM